MAELYLSLGISTKLSLYEEFLVAPLQERLRPYVLAEPFQAQLIIQQEPYEPPAGSGEELRLITREDGWLMDRGDWQLDILLGTPLKVKLRLKHSPDRYPREIRVMHVCVALQILSFLVAPHLHSIFLHTAGARLRQKTLLLVGESEAGKTTACRNAPQGAAILSDEHVLCTRGHNTWKAHATPFSSDDIRWRHPAGYSPVDAIFVLERGPLAVLPSPPTHTFRTLMRSGGKLGPLTGALALDLCTDLCTAVPAFRLITDRPEQVWPAIQDTLDC